MHYPESIPSTMTKVIAVGERNQAFREEHIISGESNHRMVCKVGDKSYSHSMALEAIPVDHLYEISEI